MSPFNAWLMFRPLRSIFCFMSTQGYAPSPSNTKKSSETSSSVELKIPLILPDSSTHSGNDFPPFRQESSTMLKRSSSY